MEYLQNDFGWLTCLTPILFKAIYQGCREIICVGPDACPNTHLRSHSWILSAANIESLTIPTAKTRMQIL